MKMSKYKQTDGYIEGVVGEETVYNEDMSMGSNYLQVLVTKTRKKDSYGEKYFNVYLIDDKFKIEPLNNLNHQIPTTHKPKNWDMYLKERALEYFAWRDYNVYIEIKRMEKA